MPGYLCPEASPPWRKRCFRKRGLPLSAEQSSTDPRARKVVGVGCALSLSKHVSIPVCACASNIIVPCRLPVFYPLVRRSLRSPRISQRKFPRSRVFSFFPLRSAEVRNEGNPLGSFSFFPTFFSTRCCGCSRRVASSMFFRFNDSLALVKQTRNSMRSHRLGLVSFRRLFSFRAT